MTSVDAVILVVALKACLPAQVVWERGGEPCGSQFLRLCPVVGDVNGDGHDDMIQHVLRLTRSGQFVNRTWSVATFSGRDGTTLQSIDYGNPPDFWNVTSMAGVGDMDGDGTRDYAVVVYSLVHTVPQRLELRSGRDASLIMTIDGPLYGNTWGLAILGDLDLDGDTRPDLVLSDYVFTRTGGNSVGRLMAYSNAGRLLYQIEGDAAQLIYYTHTSQHCVGKLGDIGSNHQSINLLLNGRVFDKL